MWHHFKQEMQTVGHLLQSGPLPHPHRPESFSINLQLAADCEIGFNGIHQTKQMDNGAIRLAVRLWSVCTFKGKDAVTYKIYP